MTKLKVGGVEYDCEDGKPIDKGKFDALMRRLAKFIDARTGEAKGHIAFDAVALEAILRRLAKFSTCDEMRKQTLDALKYRGRSFDFIRSSLRNLQSATGDALSEREKAAYQAAQDWGAHLVTQMSQSLKDEVRGAVLDGIRGRQTKREVSQSLFNAMGRLNRNWRRIANTETANNINLADCLEEVASRPKGEKVYFRRYELAGCCPQCAKADGEIALWSDAPLADDRIKDERAKVAIWEGKNKAARKNQLLVGTLHPNCRGGWCAVGSERYDAARAVQDGRDKKWAAALDKARKEFASSKEPLDDRNDAFMARVNELFADGE